MRLVSLHPALRVLHSPLLLPWGRSGFQHATSAAWLLIKPAGHGLLFQEPLSPEAKVRSASFHLGTRLLTPVCHTTGCEKDCTVCCFQLKIEERCHRVDRLQSWADASSSPAHTGWTQTTVHRSEMWGCGQGMGEDYTSGPSGPSGPTVTWLPLRQMAESTRGEETRFGNYLPHCIKIGWKEPLYFVIVQRPRHPVKPVSQPCPSPKLPFPHHLQHQGQSPAVDMT